MSCTKLTTKKGYEDSYPVLILVRVTSVLFKQVINLQKILRSTSSDLKQVTYVTYGTSIMRREYFEVEKVSEDLTPRTLDDLCSDKGRLFRGKLKVNEGNQYTQRTISEVKSLWKDFMQKIRVIRDLGSIKEGSLIMFVMNATNKQTNKHQLKENNHPFEVFPVSEQKEQMVTQRS